MGVATMFSTTPKGSQLWNKAAEFAAIRHCAQMRKGGEQVPYFTHLSRVAMIVAAFGVADPEMIAIAYLHDSVEDGVATQEEILEQFGPGVAAGVAMLTKERRKTREATDLAYYDRLGGADLKILLIKVADSVDNLIDCHEPRGSETWGRAIWKVEKVLSLVLPYESSFSVFFAADGRWAAAKKAVALARQTVLDEREAWRLETLAQAGGAE